jgi:NTP pyrophosphatase (non-canonical NTP hydrolase)
MPDMTKYRPMLERIIARYGKQDQMAKCHEECHELANALEGYPRVETEGDVIFEIADVLIMATQMAYIFGESEVKLAIDYKLERQAKRMGIEYTPVHGESLLAHPEDGDHPWRKEGV